MRDIKQKKLTGFEFDKKKMGRYLEESSQKNKHQESSIGLIRILPLALFGLRFNEADF